MWSVDSYETIRFERQDRVGTLTLTRPAKRNALNPLMWHELAELSEQLIEDGDLRCLVVAGEGPSFSAGIDLVEGIGGLFAEWADRPLDGQTLAVGLRVAGTFNWIPKLPCPSIAAVQGHALGGGFQLALACDFRIFAQSAQVGLTETRYGLLPDMGATFRLPRIVGDSRARELILLGEVIDAAEALRIGLANMVVPDSELESAASAMAARLAAQPPLAIIGARRAMDAGWHQDPDAAFRVAVEEQLRCLTSEDFKEARQALGEGREPRWSGR
jgi:enoyl-CoA hydratase/carnithine racemase